MHVHTVSHVSCLLGVKLYSDLCESMSSSFYFLTFSASVSVCLHHIKVKVRESEGASERETERNNAFKADL